MIKPRTIGYRPTGWRLVIHAVAFATLLANCHGAESAETFVDSGPSDKLVLPAPFATPSVANPPRTLGWPQGKSPSAPAGFKVTLFADRLDNPRTMLALPNRDVLVMESIRRRAGSRVILLRDKNNDGFPEQRFVYLEDLNAAFGMALYKNRLHIGNTHALTVYPFRLGDTRINRQPENLIDLPDGGHYTRNVVVDLEGKKLYISVGSATNVDAEGVDAKDPRRAAILEADIYGGNTRVYASGLRNPVGMAWEPTTKKLWTVVNERDGLGEQLVPDYLTSVKEGAFYGWPYSYFGQNVDPRKKGQRADLVAKAIKPDLALGSHVAPLGLTFYEGKSFPQRYHGGAFIGLHGSWNRAEPVGYKVVFVPFKDGKPTGKIEDFFTGFAANSKNNNQVYGRPVGVTVWHDGSLLVSDDAAGKIWRVSVAR